MQLSMNRVWCGPSVNTFKIKPIAQLIERRLKGCLVTVDPFARDSNVATLRNDLNPLMPCEFHLDAVEFAELLVERKIVADAILFDPPYSLEQAKRSYNNAGRHFAKSDAQAVNRWSKCKDLLTKVLTPGGLTISFGWSSQGFGKSRGYSIEEILLVCHGPGHHDTIVTVERKTPTI